MSNYSIGQRIVGLRTKNSAPVCGVVVDVSPEGAPCIARLRKDGSIREERLWAGQWWIVKACTTEKSQQEAFQQMSAPKSVACHYVQRHIRLTRINIFESHEEVGKVRYGCEALDKLAENLAAALCDTTEDRMQFMLDCGVEEHKARKACGAL